VSAFIHDNFLLWSESARRLYHDYAKPAPIVDYHGHLDPEDLAADRRYDNLAQLWVTNDPYKHRAMRMAGVPEQAITGSATEREKFDRWAETVPMTAGGPLHHWSAMELKRYFDWDAPLSAANAGKAWDACNAQLAGAGHTVRGLLARANVACVCTSDRLTDDLSPHVAIAREGGALRVLPSLRADDLLAVDSPGFLPWLGTLGNMTGGAIRDYEGFRAAVSRRLDVFAQAGCRLSDHGLDDFCHEPVSEAEAAGLFAGTLRGETLAARDTVRLRTALLRFLGTEYGRRGWIMQLHVGAQRRTSTRLRKLAGAAGGYSGIGVGCNVPALIAWLDDLESAGVLPRTILYPLNPADFVPLAVLSGSFVADGVPGKLQLGPAWWFNDHAAGMRAQFAAMANYGMLAVSIGMTTDARSPLSMVRQEYFRRIFCDWLGDQVETGALPPDLVEVGQLVRNVCFENARRFLSL